MPGKDEAGAEKCHIMGKGMPGFLPAGKDLYENSL